MSLVPTPRVNKHGQTVIRHMRPEGVDSGKQLAVPAPLTPSDNARAVDDPEAVITELQDFVDQTYRDAGLAYATISELDDLVERVCFLEDHTARAYLDYIKELPGRGREEVLISALHNDLSSDESGYVLFAARLREDEMDNGWDDIEGGTSHFSMSLSYAKGIEASRQQFDYPDDILSASTEDQSKADALIRVTEAVWSIKSGVFGIERTPESRSGNYIALADKELLALVVNRHDEADAIIKIVRDRKVADHETVSTVLDSGAKSLREGAL